MYYNNDVSLCSNLDKLIKPSSVKVISDDSSEKSDIVLEPLESGFALTLGNALRRVMLSSLKGSAVYGIKIEGVTHEFTSIQGVREDVTDIVLNMGMLRCKLNGASNKCLNSAVGFRLAELSAVLFENIEEVYSTTRNQVVV